MFFPNVQLLSEDYNGWIAKVLSVGQTMVVVVPRIDSVGGVNINNNRYKCRVINPLFCELAGWEKGITAKVADDVVVGGGGGFKEVKPARDPKATYCPNNHIITKFYRGGEFCPTCNLVQTADDRGKPMGWIEPF